METKPPLHVYHVHQTCATINKIHTLFFSISLLFLLYYRFSTLFQRTTSQIPIFPWLLITMSEFLLSLYWILAQAYRWRPISRTVFTDRLPNDEDLPPLDVFIFTCDPKKEPTVGVMNTVISALCIDYPPEKLFVYLSDDGGAPITLYATQEAYNFAKKWAPFCKKYGIKTIAPEAYFSQLNDEEHPHLSSEFLENLEEIKSRYIVFKQLVEKAIQSDESCLSSSRDRSACIEVMRENATDEFLKNRAEIPHLVYVSREKRSNCHHKFKAGAINVLLRVSGIISNAPCILFLDCDMYCNDPMSARQAMCFHLDPQISSSLAFVQYPQTFHNVSKNDIYNTPMRSCMKISWPGLDGLMGPALSGTCFYMKREALYKNSAQEDIDLFEGKKRFGLSDAFLASIYRNQKQIFIDNEAASNTLIEEATAVASCTYEEHTKWGKQIGFLYESVVEDVLTGMVMHCKQWISLYYNPSRPAFLGTGITNLNDSLIQTTRWYSGFLQISFSKFCPLVYQPSQMSILQTMAYLYLLFLPFTSFLVLCHSTIPQLCLFNGIRLYPKASEPWFAIFMIVYLSSPFQHLIETLFITGGSRKLFWNEQRISYFTRSTSNLFACLAFLKNLMGMKEIEFTLTDKSSNDDETNRYQMDIYNFDVDRKFLLILTTIVILNATSLAVGITRVIIEKTYNELFAQIFLSFIITVLNYPLLEGMAIRKDKGGVPVPITLFSISFVICFYYARSLVL